MLYSLILAAAQLAGPFYRGLDVSCPEYVQRSAVIAGNEFSISNVRKLGLKFLNEHPGLPFGKLLVSKTEEYLRYYSGKGATDLNFDNWQHQLSFSEEHGWAPLQDIAEVDLVSGNAVIRMRLGSKVVRILLTERDPLKIVVGDRQVEIIEFAGTTIPSAKRNSCLSSLSIFLRSDGDLAELPIRRVGRAIRSLLPRGVDIWVFARNDSWFISEPNFPPVYAFGLRGENVIPTAKQFQNSPEVPLFIPGHLAAP